MDAILKRLYYDPKLPSGFSSLRNLHQAVKKYRKGIKLEQVRDWLSKQDPYTLHAPARFKKFPRSKVLGDGYHTHVQADLADMISLRRHNDGYSYFLTAIDTFSHKIYAVPLKTKRGEEVRDAFKSIFTTLIPTHLCTDNGKEFYNKECQEWYKENGIKHYSTGSELKASMSERANRTIKERLYRFFTAKKTWRWVDVLPKIVTAINNSVNRSIGMTPNQVKPNSFLHKLNDTRPVARYQIGDTVRITKHRGVFAKGYLPRYQDEIFVVKEVINANPPYYKLQDLNEEPIVGRFYSHELIRVRSSKNNVYKIEKILRKRKRNGKTEVLVKWVGWSKAHNRWIPEADLVRL